MDTLQATQSTHTKHYWRWRHFLVSIARTGHDWSTPLVAQFCLRITLFEEWLDCTINLLLNFKFFQSFVIQISANSRYQKLRNRTSNLGILHFSVSFSERSIGFPLNFPFNVSYISFHMNYPVFVQKFVHEFFKRFFYKFTTNLSRNSNRRMSRIFFIKLLKQKYPEIIQEVPISKEHGGLGSS